MISSKESIECDFHINLTDPRNSERELSIKCTYQTGFSSKDRADWACSQVEEVEPVAAAVAGPVADWAVVRRDFDTLRAVVAAVGGVVVATVELDFGTGAWH